MGRDITMFGVFGRTFTMDGSDTAQSLPASATENLTDADINDLSAGVFITVETHPIRIAWWETPTASFGHLLSAGDAIRIKGRENVLRLKFINGTPGSNAVLMITPEFDK